MKIRFRSSREPSSLEYIIIGLALVLLVMCGCVLPIWLLAGGLGAYIAKEFGVNPWIGVAIVAVLILLGGIFRGRSQ